jgi:hypothetical protein
MERRICGVGRRPLVRFQFAVYWSISSVLFENAIPWKEDFWSAWFAGFTVLYVRRSFLLTRGNLPPPPHPRLLLTACVYFHPSLLFCGLLLSEPAEIDVHGHRKCKVLSFLGKNLLPARDLNWSVMIDKSEKLIHKALYSIRYYYPK